MEKKPKSISKKALLTKMANFCAYQERCFQDIEQKISKFEIDHSDKNWVIEELIKQKYIDELRFARSVVRGKFRFQKWGKKKIQFYLKTKGIDEIYIKKSLDEISQNEYQEIVSDLILKLNQKYQKEEDLFKRQGKIVQAMMRKGFGYDDFQGLLSKEILENLD